MLNIFVCKDNTAQRRDIVYIIHYTVLIEELYNRMSVYFRERRGAEHDV